MSWNFELKKVNLYPDKMETMLHSGRGMVGRHMGRVGRTIVLAAKRQVGVDTGALRASIVKIHSRTGQGQKMKIGSVLPYALDHHNGTPPHMIRPNNHQFLRFSGGNRVIYAREVLHPGTRPNRYLSDQLYLVRV